MRAKGARRNGTRSGQGFYCLFCGNIISAILRIISKSRTMTAL